MSYFGIDWGSSSFRAYKFDGSGEVVATIEDDKGILRVEAGDFENSLFQLLGANLQSGDTLLFSGMITSRNGWIETPYAELPAGIDSYLENGLRKKIRDVDMIFLPGVCQQSPADVIRGEELQIFGICNRDDDAMVVLPGTHSKWVQVTGGAITGFQTTMTGEVYDLLLKHSLVGLIAEGNDYLEEPFLEGIVEGAESGLQSGTLLARTFTTRAGVLLGHLEAEEVSSYLSGLLIGSEIGNGLKRIEKSSLPLLIIGNDTLCSRYATALDHLGWDRYEIISDAAIHGFGRLIRSLEEKKQ